MSFGIEDNLFRREENEKALSHEEVERYLKLVFEELNLPEEKEEIIFDFLNQIEAKDKVTYEHSIKVGLLARRIARFLSLDEKALLYAGLLHDIGKVKTPLETLQKTKGWTEADTERMRCHVVDGYYLLREYFNFTAEVILRHHRFQSSAYPEELPEPLHEYNEETKTLINFYARILALADCFDALHRKNDKFGEELTGQEIKEKMLELNPDKKKLIEELYDNGILAI